MPRIDAAWRRLNLPMQLWPSVLQTRGTDQWFEMTFNNHVLKYTVAVYGFQDPENGYPLYIGLHGGGGENPAYVQVPIEEGSSVLRSLDAEEQEQQRVWRLGDNDESWLDMAKRYYRIPVLNFSGPDGASQKGGGKGAVYVSVRGVSCLHDNLKSYDDWDLHSQPESFVLVERVVRNLLLPNPVELYQATDYSKLLTGAKSLVDANRVYMLGFSAGGDGAFQFAARLPDLFASINAGGGHPNGVSLANTSNLPLSLQVGEKDDTVADRARVYAEVHFDLLRRQAELAQRGYKDRYVHKTCIVQGGDHDSWSQPEVSDKKYPILSDLQKWYNHPTEAGSQKTVDEIIAPVPWVSQRTREPYPQIVVWDLATRPKTPKILKTMPPTVWQPKQFFYWLYIRYEDPAAPYQDKIMAWYDTASNSVHVDKPTEYLGILLHNKMFDLGKNIDVYIGDKKIQSIMPKVVMDIAVQTWNLHHDKSLLFSSAIYFEAAGHNWVVKNADTLFVSNPKLASSKL